MIQRCHDDAFGAAYRLRSEDHLVAQGPRTRRVADFVFELRWEDLPAPVQEQAVRVLLDLCGCAIGGSRTRVAQIFAAYARHTHGSGDVTIIGSSLTDPEHRALAARVEMVHDPSIEAVFPDQALAWVEVETTDGRSARSGLIAAHGDPDAPLTDSERMEKYRWLVTPVLGSRRAEELLATIEALPSAGDIRDLTHRLRDES